MSLEELFHGLSQLAPGNQECTLRALGAVEGLPRRPRILDVGCGTGRQTLTLAQHCNGRVLATDIDASCLAEVERRAVAEGLTSRVETRLASMSDLGLPDGSFDLIWSEGAIYHMGLEAGLAAWRALLAPRGCVAVSELSWLSADPPQTTRDFWLHAYPAMASREENERAVERAGYALIESFALPDDAWHDYYGPLEQRISRLRARHAGDPNAEGDLAYLAGIEREVEVFKTREGSYSYVFYVARRTP